LSEINIVPVSISYEFDPCDRDKAIELAERDATGSYQKKENEDLNSITQGLNGKKGRVHVEFCHAIKGDFIDTKAVAKAIDQEIIANYKLYDSNLTAYAKLHQKDDIKQNVLAQLNSRMAELTQEQQQWLLTMYANPVSAKQTLE